MGVGDFAVRVYPSDVFVHTGIEKIYAFVGHSELPPQQLDVLLNAVGVDGESLFFDGQGLWGIEYDWTVSGHAVGCRAGDVHLALQTTRGGTPQRLVETRPSEHFTFVGFLFDWLWLQA